ncbi:Uncharacterized protein (Fragment), partial [Durusdinium trenchii]
MGRKPMFGKNRGSSTELFATPDRTLDDVRLLSDLLLGMSYILLLGYVRSRPSSKWDEGPGRYMPLPPFALVFGLASAAVFAASKFHKGAEDMEVLLLLLSSSINLLKKSPLNVVMTAVQNDYKIFEMVMAFGFVVSASSAMVADFMSRMVYLLFGSGKRAEEARELDSKIAQAEADAKKNKSPGGKKGKQQQKEQDKKAKATQKAPESKPKPGLPPAGGYEMGLYVVIAVTAMVVTLVAALTFLQTQLPRSKAPKTPEDWFPLFKEILPFRFGVLMLLETVGLLAEPNALFTKKPSGGLQVTSAATALLVRFAAACLLFGAMIVDIGASGQGFMKLLERDMAHMLVVGLFIVTLAVGLVPRYAKAHSTGLTLVVILLASAVGAIVNPASIPAQLHVTPLALHKGLTTTTVMTVPLMMVLGGSMTIGVAMLVGTLVVSLYSEEFAVLAIPCVTAASCAPATPASAAALPHGSHQTAGQSGPVVAEQPLAWRWTPQELVRRLREAPRAQQQQQVHALVPHSREANYVSQWKSKTRKMPALKALKQFASDGANKKPLQLRLDPALFWREHEDLPDILQDPRCEL